MQGFGSCIVTLRFTLVGGWRWHFWWEREVGLTRHFPHLPQISPFAQATAWSILPHDKFSVGFRCTHSMNQFYYHQVQIAHKSVFLHFLKAWNLWPKSCGMFVRLCYIFVCTFHWFLAWHSCSCTMRNNFLLYKFNFPRNGLHKIPLQYLEPELNSMIV
jgi:hypothetical protein